MRVLITGGSGFIGGHVAAALLHAGHAVVSLQRDPTRAVAVGRRVLDLPILPLRTGQPPDAALFADADAVIHLIHDKNLMEAGLNAYLDWYAALEQGIAAHGARQIYVSSYSARPDAVSLYGRAKHRLERMFLEHGHSIVRPGLVLGRGGLFGRILGLMERLPVLPVPGGRRQKMPYISAPLLGAALERCLMSAPRELNAFAPHLSDLPELLHAAARRLGLHRLLVPVSANLTLAGLLLLERCGLRLPVTSDNLRGAMVNQAACHVANMESCLGLQETVNEAVDAALRR